jgi:hypothetical protein
LSLLDVGIDVVRLRAEILGGTTRPLRSERLLFGDRLLAAGARGTLVRLGGLPLCSEVVRTRLLARAGRFFAVCLASAVGAPAHHDDQEDDHQNGDYTQRDDDSNHVLILPTK